MAENAGAHMKPRRSENHETFISHGIPHTRTLHTLCAPLYPLGESNPCFRTENPASWATRRRGPICSGGTPRSVPSFISHSPSPSTPARTNLPYERRPIGDERHRNQSVSGSDRIAFHKVPSPLISVENTAACTTRGSTDGKSV